MRSRSQHRSQLWSVFKDIQFCALAVQGELGSVAAQPELPLKKDFGRCHHLQLRDRALVGAVVDYCDIGGVVDLEELKTF